MTDDVVRCPRGHQVRRDELLVRDGKALCPHCVTTGRAPAPRPPWSRQALVPVAWLLAAGAALLAAGDVAGLLGYTHTLHLTNSNAGGWSFLLAAAGHGLLATAAATAAGLLSRD